MAIFRYPKFANNRGAGYWLRLPNLWASRFKFLRADHSNRWRYSFGNTFPPDRVVPFNNVLPPNRDPQKGFRFLILGDTGEGDRSQYGLIPLIKALKPDFMIIDGDEANPSGRIDELNKSRHDYLNGFFEPYKNFNIAIWAVPGNHEYYSEYNGREFYDIFCTRKYNSLWAEYGLRFVKQPGTYWQLVDETSKLAVIGIDSGKAGNLDGNNNWTRFLKGKVYPDVKQHEWLEERLKIAQQENYKVILMFHIPALVKEKEDVEGLKILHRIIIQYPCVKIVICGHEHNFQFYTPEVFKTFVTEKCGGTILSGNNSPQYMVNGGGGSFLHSTNFAAGNYKAKKIYPSSTDYLELARAGRKIVDALGFPKALDGLISRIEVSAIGDGDFARYLSFLLFEVTPKENEPGEFETKVTPVFLDDLQSLYRYLPKDSIVNIPDDVNLPDEKTVQNCLQTNLSQIL